MEQKYRAYKYTSTSGGRTVVASEYFQNLVGTGVTVKDIVKGIVKMFVLP